MLRQLLPAARIAARPLRLARRSMGSMHPPAARPRAKKTNYLIPHFNPRDSRHARGPPPAQIVMAEDGAEAPETQRPWRRQAPVLIELPEALEAGMNASTLQRLRDGARDGREQRSLCSKKARKARQAIDSAAGASAGADGVPDSLAAPEPGESAAHPRPGDGRRRAGGHGGFGSGGGPAAAGVGGASGEEGEADEPSVDAFAAHRLHGAYAGSYRMLWEAQARMPPGWAPRDSLEFGAGLAPASWAAAELWPDAGLRCTAVEPNPHLRRAGAELCQAGASSSVLDGPDGAREAHRFVVAGGRALPPLSGDATAAGSVGAAPAPLIEWVNRLRPLSAQYDVVRLLRAPKTKLEDGASPSPHKCAYSTLRNKSQT